MDGDSAGAITRHGREVGSVYDLLGRAENDLTSALGFTLARSPLFLATIARRLLGPHAADTAYIRMEVRDEAGRTDLEIDTGKHLIVVEAKRGWHLPEVEQLSRYVSRIQARGSGFLVTLSDASMEWAQLKLPTQVDGIPVKHVAWSIVRSDLANAAKGAKGRERMWLDELQDYLRRAVKVRDPADGWTYCVAVSDQAIGGSGKRTYRSVVTEESTYFHPHGWGSGWPKTPPNFLGFRWDGSVQQVRRVSEAAVVPNLQARWNDIPEREDTVQPHVVYRLGPALPGLPIPNGKQYRAGRLWVLLDQLLTSPTLAAAHASSRELQGAAAGN